MDEAAVRAARRRGAIVAVIVVAAAVVAACQLGGDDPGDVQAPAQRTPVVADGGEGGEKVWPKWDPRDADELPAAPDRVASVLPDVIDPPASSPNLRDHPLEAGVLVHERNGTVQVLGRDGSWRTIPAAGDYLRAHLSPDGTRVVVYGGGDARGPATVYTLPTGAVSVFEPPPGFEPWDHTTWSFLDADSLLLTSGKSAHEIEMETGEATARPLPHHMRVSQTVDPAGKLLIAAGWTKPNVLYDYADGSERAISMSDTGRLTTIRANGELVVGTTYDGRPFSLVLADRATLSPRASLPLGDHDANYSNGGLGAVALREDGTVLFRVAAFGDRAGFRVVAWDPGTGEISLVSRVLGDGQVSFADGLLRS